MAKRIRLVKGWYMELDSSTREEGEQGFVFSPDGRHSSSLACAIGTGMTSDTDEIEIPQEVLAELEKYEDQYA